MEGTGAHFHAHLDILADATAVPVSQGIGIGPTGMSGNVNPSRTHFGCFGVPEAT